MTPGIPLRWHIASEHGALIRIQTGYVTGENKGLKGLEHELELFSLELWPTGFVLKTTWHKAPMRIYLLLLLIKAPVGRGNKREIYHWVVL